MSLDFEWDARKAERNRRKHRVSFEEASTAFGDPMSLTVPDPDHSEDEQRFVLLGLSEGGRLLTVAHTNRGDSIRIISARKASKAEGRRYGQSKG